MSEVGRSVVEIPGWAWILWGSVSLTTFLVLEVIALTNERTGDTLSENIRRWLGITPPSPVRQVAVPVFVAVLLGFVAWFLPHILFSIA